MTDLKQQYDHMWKSGIEKISSGNIYCDLQLDRLDDHRFGITLLARPDSKTAEEIERFCENLRDIEPHQYYYPISDMHITILSIISCYDGFRGDKLDVGRYIELIELAVRNYSTFEIKFEGITASNSAVMVQGFPQDHALENLRNDLRNAFKSSNLEHSIDSRYRLETAHATVIRFKKPFENSDQFSNKLQEYREHPFGVSTIKDLELVFNDWYQTSAKVRHLRTFKL